MGRVPVVENLFDQRRSGADARRAALAAAIATLPATPTGRPAAMTATPAAIEETGHAVAPVDALAVPEALDGLLPAGLRRGSVVGVDEDGYLTAALVAAAIADGGCAALVGAGEVGLEAVAAAGGDLERIVLVEAGERWGAAIEVLCGAVDLIVLYGTERVTASQARRVAARLRAGRARTVLLACGPGWDAPVRLRVEDARWIGLGEAGGQLAGRRAAVLADGSGCYGRTQVAHLWLPAADGTVLEQSDPRAIPERPRHLALVDAPVAAA